MNSNNNKSSLQIFTHSGELLLTDRKIDLGKISPIRKNAIDVHIPFITREGNMNNTSNLSVENQQWQFQLMNTINVSSSNINPYSPTKLPSPKNTHNNNTATAIPPTTKNFLLESHVQQRKNMQSIKANKINGKINGVKLKLQDGVPPYSDSELMTIKCLRSGSFSFIII